MANIRGTPGSDDEPIESRRSGVGQPDPDQPVTPDEGEPPAADQIELGEFAAESARPTPLDDIAEAEREQLPRD